MQRVVNFRCFLLTSTIAAFCILLYTKTSAALRVTLLAATFAVLLGLAITFLVSRDYVKAVSFVLSILVAVACVIGAKIGIDNRKYELKEQVAYAFTGIIDEASGSGDYRNFSMREVKADGKSVGGKVRLTVSSVRGTVAVMLKAGDEVSFESTVFFVESEMKIGKYNRNDIRYVAKLTGDEIAFTGSSMGFFDSMRNGMKSILEENAGSYGSLAYAVLTGDKGGLEEGITDYYGTSGIGHILAVSGLHVGFITAALAWILGKLRLNRYAKLGIVSSTLLFYCFLASFSPSVVRASVMCVIGLTADAFGKRRDSLSGLCAAVTAILAIKPLYVYDVGFVLSVSAVAGILMFAETIKRLLKFLPGFLSGAMSVSVAAQIGITPTMLVVFGKFTPYSIFANLLVIPVMSVTFVVIVLAVCVVAIIPRFGILLTISCSGLVLVDLIARLVSFIPFASVLILAEEWFMLCYIPMFCCSRFFMTPRFKWINIVSAVAACVVALAICNVPTTDPDDVIACKGYDGVTTIIGTSDYGSLIVGDVNASGTITDVLGKTRTRKVGAIVLTSISEDNASPVAFLCSNYGISEVYASSYANIDGMQALISEGVDVRLFDGEKFGLKPVFSHGEFVGYGCPSKSLLLLTAGSNPAKLDSAIVNEYAVIRSETYGYEYLDRVYLVNFPNSFTEDKPIAVKSTSDGNFVFDTKDGTSRNL